MIDAILTEPGPFVILTSVGPLGRHRAVVSWVADRDFLPPLPASEGPLPRDWHQFADRESAEGLCLRLTQFPERMVATYQEAVGARWGVLSTPSKKTSPAPVDLRTSIFEGRDPAHVCPGSRYGAPSGGGCSCPKAWG